MNLDVCLGYGYDFSGHYDMHPDPFGFKVS